MKNVLERLESVIASTDATLSRKLVDAPRSRKLSEANNDEPLRKFINGGAKHPTAKLLAKFIKKHENDLEISEQGQKGDMYGYTVIIPLKYDLEVFITLKMTSTGDAAIESTALFGDTGDDMISDLGDSLINSISGK
jgi:hypothetical protein